MRDSMDLQTRAPALGQEYLSREPERILRPHRDEYLFGRCRNSTAWQRVAGNKLDQLWVVLIVVVRGHRAEVALTQSLQRAEAPVGVIKQRLIA